MNETLRDWILSYSSYNKAAKALGVSRSSVSCWVRGKRDISLINCMKIEKLTDGQITTSKLRPDLMTDMLDQQRFINE